MDPLSQLKDIHLPEPVSWWPPAIGWWLLTALLVAVIIAATLYYCYWYKYRRYRHQALRDLKTLYQQAQAGNHPRFPDDVAVLLKKTAMQQEPATAGMQGEQWQHYLQQHMPEKVARWIAINRYQPEASIDTTELYHAARQWIREH